MSIPKTIGRYEILDELGHGAMGSVFRAHDPAMDRIVALKTILSVALASEQGSEYRQRFYREARAAGAMAHPGIVAVFDVGEHEGVPFLVMEFVQGRTLADAMKTGERASLERVCEIGEQIAEALGYAHRHGVIHRDIKPANILLTSREIYGAERPKITDFGVAKLASQGITTTGQMLGTPAFMPPEQFTGAPIDGRTDLFSLGVILYWMATGEQPFPGESMTSVSYKIVHTEPAPPAKLNPAIPPRMEGVIMKCLAKNPANRYQTGEESWRGILRCCALIPWLQACWFPGRRQWEPAEGRRRLWIAAPARHGSLFRPPPARWLRPRSLEPPRPKRSVARCCFWQPFFWPQSPRGAGTCCIATILPRSCRRQRHLRRQGPKRRKRQRRPKRGERQRRPPRSSRARRPPPQPSIPRRSIQSRTPA